MKKLLVILAIVLLPLSAFAGMSAITDSEMSAVTGQMGVSIAIVDMQQDISLASLTWGDVNNGTRYVAGQAVSIAPGYVNINDITINKNTMTLNGVTGTNGVYADPLKIDVVSFGPVNILTQPFAAFSNKTAVIIGLPDLVQTVDAINIGSITLDNRVAGVTVYAALSAATNFTTANATSRASGAAFYSVLNAGGGYHYWNTSAQANSNQLGQIYIKGFKQITYSHLEGYGSTLTTTLGTVSLNCANRPGYIAIFAHDTQGK